MSDPGVLVDQLEAALENARRLGLSTMLRPGVVAPTSSVINDVVYVKMDNDTQAVGCMSLIGEELQPTQRVMVMFVRPQGAYVIGYIGSKILPPWHYIGGSNEPAFTNSWVNYGAGNHRTARFQKVGDRVYVEGLIAAGVVGSSAFTLPEGYRPPMIVIHAAIAAAGASSGLCRVDFEDDGNVIPQTTVDTPFNGFCDINMSFSVTA